MDKKLNCVSSFLCTHYCGFGSYYVDSWFDQSRHDLGFVSREACTYIQFNIEESKYYKYSMERIDVLKPRFLLHLVYCN